MTHRSWEINRHSANKEKSVLYGTNRFVVISTTVHASYTSPQKPSRCNISIYADLSGMIHPIQVIKLNFCVHLSNALHTTCPTHHLAVHQSDNIERSRRFSLRRQLFLVT